MTIDMLPWVISRATGITAMLALSGAMVAGLLVRTRTTVGPVKGAWMVDIHRLLSGTALVAIAIHGTALLFDGTVSVSPTQLLIPGTTEYRPVWTGLGVIAAELALVVHLSFRWRHRIGVQTWRRLHTVTYGVFTLGLVHGIAAGTDTGKPWVMALYGGVTGAVLGLTGWRVVTAKRRGARAARPQAPARGAQTSS